MERLMILNALAINGVRRFFGADSPPGTKRAEQEADDHGKPPFPKTGKETVTAITPMKL